MRHIDITDECYTKLRELQQLEARNGNAPPPTFPHAALSELIGDLVDERLCFARTLGAAVRTLRGRR